MSSSVSKKQVKTLSRKNKWKFSNIQKYTTLCKFLVQKPLWSSKLVKVVCLKRHSCCMHYACDSTAGGKSGLMPHLNLNLFSKLTAPAVISLITFKLFTRRHKFIRHSRREKAVEKRPSRECQREADVYSHSKKNKNKKTISASRSSVMLSNPCCDKCVCRYQPPELWESESWGSTTLGEKNFVTKTVCLISS